MVENENDIAEWPDALIRDDQMRLVMQGPYCTLTGCSVESDQWWPDASDQQSTLLERDQTRLIVFLSRPISLLTLCDTCQYDQRIRSS
jgi:hypothetical protein